ncbi:hypothetical protein ACN47E_008181 [Coniothyrium glycines]
MTGIDDHDFPPLPSQWRHKRASKRDKTINLNDASSMLSRARGSISDLPDELILEILDYLPGIHMDHFQLSTLWSLSATNRRFHRIVAERLYAKYDSHFCEPYTFLRTMVTNSHLADSVRNISITNGRNAHESRQRYNPSAQDKKIIKEGMRSLGIPNWKIWASDCNTPIVQMDILHSAILMHARNVNSLTIHETWVEHPTEPKWIELLRRASTGTNPGKVHNFTHLSSVRVNVGKLKLTQLTPLFRLQQLRKLYLRDVHNHEVINDRSVSALKRLLPSQCNNLAELHLEQAFLNMDMLGILLASPRTLNVFKYEVWADNVPQGMDPQHLMGTMRFSSVLSPQVHSLQDLYVMLDTIAESSVLRSIHILECIAGMTKLQHLRCPMSTIIDGSGNMMPFIESLPASIQSWRTDVRQRSKLKDGTSALAQAAAYSRTKLPKLTRIHVDISPEHEEWHDYDWEAEVQAFSKTDVSFVVEREEVPDWPRARWESDASSSSSWSSEEEVDLYSE